MATSLSEPISADRDRAIDDARDLFGAKVVDIRNWTPKDKLELFMQRFAGQTHRFIVQKGDGATCIKEPLTPTLYQAHLLGKQRLGVFPVVDGKTKLGCIDLDSDRPEHARALYAPCQRLGIRAKLATSRSGNYHLYVFMSEWIEAPKVRALMDMVVEQSGLPFKKGEKGKQGFEPGIDKGRVYPCDAAIFLPLFGLRHALEKTGRGVFVDPDSLKPFDGLNAQWRELIDI